MQLERPPRGRHRHRRTAASSCAASPGRSRCVELSGVPSLARAQRHRRALDPQPVRRLSHGRRRRRVRRVSSTLAPSVAADRAPTRQRAVARHDLGAVAAARRSGSARPLRLGAARSRSPARVDGDASSATLTSRRRRAALGLELVARRCRRRRRPELVRRRRRLRRRARGRPLVAALGRAVADAFGDASPAGCRSTIRSRCRPAGPRRPVRHSERPRHARRRLARRLAHPARWSAGGTSLGVEIVRTRDDQSAATTERCACSDGPAVRSRICGRVRRHPDAPSVRSPTRRRMRRARHRRARTSRDADAHRDGASTCRRGRPPDSAPADDRLRASRLAIDDVVADGIDVRGRVRRGRDLASATSRPRLVDR